MKLVDKLLDNVRNLNEVAERNIFVFIQQRVAFFNDHLKPPDSNVVLQQVLGSAHSEATGWT